MKERLDLDSNFAMFVRLRESILQFLSRSLVSDEKISEVLIVAEEIFTNIIKHAYNRTEGNPIIIEMELEDGGKLRMTFYDKGIPRDDLTIPQSLEQLKGKIGGLGLYLIGKYSDMFEYSNRDGWNIHCVEKHIT